MSLTVSSVFNQTQTARIVTNPNANQQEWCPDDMAIAVALNGTNKSCTGRIVEDKAMAVFLKAEEQYLKEKISLFDIPTIRVLEAELSKSISELRANESAIKNLKDLMKKNKEYGIEYNVSATKTNLKKLQNVNSELKRQILQKYEELEKIVTMVYEGIPELHTSKSQYPEVAAMDYYGRGKGLVFNLSVIMPVLEIKIDAIAQRVDSLRSVCHVQQ